MNDKLREAAQQALEALHLSNHEWKQLADSGDCGNWTAESQDHYQQANEAIAALEAALAQQPEPAQEPVAQAMQDAAVYGVGISRDGKRIDPASIYEQPAQEPVYWEVRCTAHPKWMRVDEQQFDEYVANGWEGQRLYTAPPQRPPLTDGEIAEATAGVLGLPHEIKVELARAIERKVRGE